MGWRYEHKAKSALPGDGEAYYPNEICAASEIHRSSFYLHYKDIYDLMDQIEKRLGEYYGNLFSSPAEDYDLGQKFEQLFSFVREHQDFYRAYLVRHAELHALNVVISDVGMESMRSLVEALGFQTENEVFYHHAFFRAGITAMLREWVQRGCQESPEEMCRVLTREYAPNRELFQ